MDERKFNIAQSLRRSHKNKRTLKNLSEILLDPKAYCFDQPTKKNSSRIAKFNITEEINTVVQNQLIDFTTEERILQEDQYGIDAETFYWQEDKQNEIEWIIQLEQSEQIENECINNKHMDKKKV
jgi:hypothetical protein